MSRRLPYILLLLVLVLAGGGAGVASLLGLKGAVRYADAPTGGGSLPPARSTSTETTSAIAADRPPEVERLQGIELLDAADIPPHAAAQAPPSPPAPAEEHPAEPASPPRLALIVTGVGLAKAKSERALTLPKGVTLAVSPYAKDAADWLKRVRESGHEAALMLPLESTDPARIDNGPLALRPESDAAALEAGLTRIVGKAGKPLVLVGPTGAFGADKRAGGTLARLLKKHEATFIELSGETLAGTAGEVGLAYGRAADPIDGKPDAAGVDTGLGQLEGRSLEHGMAIGWLEGIPVALDRVVPWIEGLHGKGLELVAASSLAHEGTGDSHAP